MVIGIAGLFIKGALFATHPAAMAFQAAMFLLMAWSRIVFGRRSFHAAADPTAGGLVTTGPYAYLRHPIYAAVIHFAWAGALSHFSWSVLAYGQTTRQDSPHSRDQLRLFASHQLRRAWFTEPDIKANLERSYRP